MVSVPRSDLTGLVKTEFDCLALARMKAFALPKHACVVFNQSIFNKYDYLHFS